MSAPTDRPAASAARNAEPATTEGRHGRARNTEPATTGGQHGRAHDTEPAIAGGQHGRALAVLIIAIVAMAVLPDLVQYLNVKHEPYLDHLLPRLPLARDVSLTASVVLFLVCSIIILGRGHVNRNIGGAVVLLLGLLVPYAINPTLPGIADIVKVALAAAVILAVWNVGASVDVLKWVPITGSLIASYSIIGALIAPEYMNYETTARKAIIANWQLAGPFGHSNSLGNYCVLALALIPLITSIRWRILNGSILCMAIVASASRTALIAAGVLALWWIICRLRSMTSVRHAGTAMIAFCAATMLVLPLVSSNPSAFTGRGYAWAASLNAWQESRLVGLGLDWFSTTRVYFANSASWAFPTGHNLFVDTIARSGLVGICVLALVLLAATCSTRALAVPSHQIACFGYLIAFLVASSTEAIWVLLPNMALFPVVGFVLAVVIVARRGVQARGE